MLEIDNKIIVSFILLSVAIAVNNRSIRDYSAMNILYKSNTCWHKKSPDLYGIVTVWRNDGWQWRDHKFFLTALAGLTFTSGCVLHGSEECLIHLHTQLDSLETTAVWKAQGFQPTIFLSHHVLVSKAVQSKSSYLYMQINLVICCFVQERSFIVHKNYKNTIKKLHKKLKVNL